MKKAMVVFLSILFVVCLVGSSLAEEMNIDTKWRLYNAESKSPWLAVGAAWFVPTLGHAYAGDWIKGLPFLGAEAVGIALMISGASQPSGTGGMGTTSTIGFWTVIVARIWEYVDAYGTAENFNKTLKEKYNISFKLEEFSPELALKYSF